MQPSEQHHVQRTGYCMMDRAQMRRYKHDRASHPRSIDDHTLTEMHVRARNSMLADADVRTTWARWEEATHTLIVAEVVVVSLCAAQYLSTHSPVSMYRLPMHLQHAFPVCPDVTQTTGTCVRTGQPEQRRSRLCVQKGHKQKHACMDLRTDCTC